MRTSASRGSGSPALRSAAPTGNPVSADRTTADSTGRWTPEVLTAVREHYRLAFRDTINTYVPK